jgi:hypothetical protein
MGGANALMMALGKREKRLIFGYSPAENRV